MDDGGEREREREASLWLLKAANLVQHFIFYFANAYGGVGGGSVTRRVGGWGVADLSVAPLGSTQACFHSRLQLEN